MYIDNQTILRIFYKMLKARLFEEKLVLMKEDGLLDAPLYLSIGQEATAAAVLALRSDDTIFSSHRSLTIAIASDIDIAVLLAEITGLEEGLCHGRSGMTAFADNSMNYYGNTSLAGGNFTKAVGAALAAKLQNQEYRTVCFAGDGACADGSFYEALNMACLYQLPIVFFIENNRYAARSSVNKVHNVSDIAERAKGYNIPGIIVDGNNPIEVYGGMAKALEYVTDSKMPILIESQTYRLAGHTFDEDQSYRNEEEIHEWLTYDAIDNITAYMIENKIGIEDDLMMLRSKIEEEINAAAEYVLSLIDPQLDQRQTETEDKDPISTESETTEIVEEKNEEFLTEDIESDETIAINVSEELAEEETPEEDSDEKFIFTGFENE